MAVLLTAIQRINRVTLKLVSDVSRNCRSTASLYHNSSRSSDLMSIDTGATFSCIQDVAPNLVEVSSRAGCGVMPGVIGAGWKAKTGLCGSLALLAGNIHMGPTYLPHSGPIVRHTHTGTASSKRNKRHGEPQEWPKYNDILYPPQEPGEPRRPAEVVHLRSNIKYSTKKLWYIACLIRGMSVEEAIKQLSFYRRKGSAVVKEVIEEAQEMAVRDHNVEYKSNLWIEDSFVRKAKTIYGLRRHAKQRYCRIHYRYTHYFLRLREGRPPKHYYPPRPTGHEMVEGTLAQFRARTIQKSL